MFTSKKTSQCCHYTVDRTKTFSREVIKFFCETKKRKNSLLHYNIKAHHVYLQQSSVPKYHDFSIHSGLLSIYISYNNKYLITTHLFYLP